MCVNVRRSWEVAVTKPFLNLLHGNTVCQKKRGTAMPEIVIPDLSHFLCLEQFRKTLCDVVGLDQIANLIDTYITQDIPWCSCVRTSGGFPAALLSGREVFPAWKEQEAVFSYSIWSLWCLTQPELACRGLAEQTGEQGDESRADQHHTPASHELLDTLRFCLCVIKK